MFTKIEGVSAYVYTWPKYIIHARTKPQLENHDNVVCMNNMHMCVCVSACATCNKNVFMVNVTRSLKQQQQQQKLNFTSKLLVVWTLYSIGVFRLFILYQEGTDGDIDLVLWNIWTHYIWLNYWPYTPCHYLLGVFLFTCRLNKWLFVGV